MLQDINIRKAELEDFEMLYGFGLTVPEIKLSAQMPFVGRGEFQWYIENPNSIFLMAEAGGQFAGFVCGDVEKEKDKYAAGERWASLIYIAVKPEFRGQGIAKKLFDEFQAQVKARGATILYSWANAEEKSAIVPFFEKQGLVPGHVYRWMDKKL